MTKDYFIEELQKHSSELSEWIAQLDSSTLNKEKGSIVCQRIGNKTRFLLYTNEGKPQKTYINSKQRDLLGKLARKSYIGKMSSAAKAEKEQIDRCLTILQKNPKKTDTTKVYESIPDELKPFINPTTVSDDGFALQWVKDVRQSRNRQRTINGALKTKNGETVKSKSELIIADRLFDSGVPYVYENTISLDDEFSRTFPDFTVLNKRTRKVFLWEHFGKMDDPQYCFRTQIKLEQYANKGYFPGKNLIMTFESSTRELSTSYIDQIIKEYLL